MNFGKAWTIARKDFSIFRQKPAVLYVLIAVPMLIGVGLPLLLDEIVHRRGVTFASLLPLSNAFAFFFVISSVGLTTSLASYSIVGEKAERTLEPLLATPATDGEILVGKVLAAFVPTVLSTFAGLTVFMLIYDAVSHADLGYVLYPNGEIAITIVGAVPLACLCSVEVNVFVSSRVSDVRTAQQSSVLLVFPFAAIYVLGELGAISIDTTTMEVVTAILLVADLALLPLMRATFQREEILTRWK